MDTMTDKPSQNALFDDQPEQSVKKSGMGSHHSAVAGNDEWLTPPAVLKALGHFDLDPCSPINRPWPTADEHFTVLDNGLQQPWYGRVWCNPPYGPEAANWLARCVHHGNAIALIFARTETEMFFDHVWPKADAVLFLRGRLYFHYVDGRVAEANSGAPSVLVAYGKNNAEMLKNCGLGGVFIPSGQWEIK